MAAYGAVASLVLSLDTVLPPVHLRSQFETLYEKVSFLQHSLEDCLGKLGNQEIYDESFEARIRDTVFKAEYVIASKIANHSVHQLEPNIDEIFYKIIEEIGYIEGEMKMIMYSDGAKGQWWATRNLRSTSSPWSRDKFSVGNGRKLVLRYEEAVEEIKTRLYDDSLKLEIVPIVGMGGIGKTTLAKRVYDESVVDRHFDIHAWTTVSQEYSPQKVLESLLDSGNMLNTDMVDGMEEENLALNLFRNLKYRRYLIVIDDVWDTHIWDAMGRYFPDDNNRSRVLLTTRLSKVALYASPRRPICQMSVLNEDDSWNLLCNEIFIENDCPMELELIGKKIARNCKGLPLAIVVTAGFLSKVSRTKEDWTSVADNLSSAVAKDDGECMKILSLSYKFLPHYLRPCFLYMAMFPEDYVIHVPKLLHLWAAEGFLKPANKLICPEVLAEEYLEDLVERNLVLVWKRSASGKIKTCKIHDMLWNFCMQRSRKEHFLHVVKWQGNVLQDGIDAPRRFCIHHCHYGHSPKIFIDIMTRVHSLIYTGNERTAIPPRMRQFYISYHMLLKVLDLYIVQLIHFPDTITRLVNLRYLAVTCDYAIPLSISQLQKLETFVYRNWKSGGILSEQIWLMTRLRYIWVTDLYLINPLDMNIQEEGSFILENLQTLVGVRDLVCGNIQRRMPNLKELGITYYENFFHVWEDYQLEALANLHQLEILNLLLVNYSRFPKTWAQQPPELAFPKTLRILTLEGCRIPWKSMTSVGSLPCLEVLKLCRDACEGAEWEPNVNEFRQLKYLQLKYLHLAQWKADESHFPRLKRLIIKFCRNLQEIPTGIGDISTLEEIKLVHNFNINLASSVKRIQKEQQDLGNNNLKIFLG